MIPIKDSLYSKAQLYLTNQGKNDGQRLLTTSMKVLATF